VTASRLHKGRSFVVPGLAALVALAILIGLGTWQLQRMAWKQDLIAQIQARAYGEPGAVVPESDWASWRADRDEFRKVRVTGTFLHEFEAPVYGLAPGERQGTAHRRPLDVADSAAHGDALRSGRGLRGETWPGLDTLLASVSTAEHGCVRFSSGL